MDLNDLVNGNYGKLPGEMTAYGTFEDLSSAPTRGKPEGNIYAVHCRIDPRLLSALSADISERAHAFCRYYRGVQEGARAHAFFLSFKDREFADIEKKGLYAGNYRRYKLCHNSVQLAIGIYLARFQNQVDRELDYLREGLRIYEVMPKDLKRVVLDLFVRPMIAARQHEDCALFRSTEKDFVAFADDATRFHIESLCLVLAEEGITEEDKSVRDLLSMLSALSSEDYEMAAVLRDKIVKARQPKTS